MYRKQRLNKDRNVSIREAHPGVPIFALSIRGSRNGQVGLFPGRKHPSPPSPRSLTSPPVTGAPHFLSRNPIQVLGSYWPSSIPVKSEPFWMVMGAPAALSTKMEAYCPACGGTRTQVTLGNAGGGAAAHSPVAPGAPERPP